MPSLAVGALLCSVLVTTHAQPIPLWRTNYANVSQQFVPKCLYGQPYKIPVAEKYKTCSLAACAECPPNYECYYDGVWHACCPQRDIICAAKYNQGLPCSQYEPRWYYDPPTLSCLEYLHSMCPNNPRESPNSFRTKIDCEVFCGGADQYADGWMRCPGGSIPYRDNWSNCLNMCINCPSTHQCIPVNINGKLVNYCCPKR